MPANRSSTRRTRHLHINRFSAFQEINVSFKGLTILTGPQASGKSLLCKLLYYFQEVFDEILKHVQDSQSLAQFVKAQSLRFVEWFPPSAWGQAKFRIVYSVDGLDIEVLRASGRGGVKNTVNIKFSDSLSTLYDETLISFEQSRKKVSRDDQFVYIRSEQNYRFREQFYKAVATEFGSSYVSSQTYIPASRAFFTTIGRAMSAFEHGQLLDPITKSFGRDYIALTDRLRHGFPLNYGYQSVRTQGGARFRNARMAEIFGGKPRLERNEVVIEASDGRFIPLNALSSGQQELLPLWLSLDYFDNTISFINTQRGANLLYIEEPEAHLFPEAQAGVLEILASLLRRQDASAQLIVTTHSPYLLAKTNNLLMAGRLGFRKRLARQKQVDEIIPRTRWLLPGEVSCYGLNNGEAIDLLGLDGLISTDYIDEVSQDIVDQFSRLCNVL